MTKKIDYTPEQLVAINVADRNLIVSAGAGAGKTSTLVERVYRLVAEGTPKADLSEMLIVTFTRLAAEEMRTRLAARIAKALEDEGSTNNQHLLDQLYHLPRAQISTIHSFCLEVIGEFPEKAGLAPGFEMMTEEESRLYIRSFIEKKMNESLEKGDGASSVFRAIVQQTDLLGGWDQIPQMIGSVFNFLSSVPDHKAFLSLLSNATQSDSQQWTLVYTYIQSRISAGIQALETLRTIPFNELNPKNQAFLEKIDVRINELKSFDAKSPNGPINEDLLDLLKLPRIASVKEEDRSRADWKLKSLWDDVVKKVISKAREDFKPFTEFSKDDVFLVNEDLLWNFMEQVAIPWYEEYFESHLEKRRLTFAHLERVALRVLYTDDWQLDEAAYHYQRQFRYVLIDEFQDVNELQNRIIRAVARQETDNLGGNLFVVGDVKQSIYQFRQAEPQLFLDVYDRSHDYTPESEEFIDTRLNLANNFRSHPALLNEFNGLFSLLFYRGTVGVDYKEGHTFQPGRDDNDAHREPEFSLTLLEKLPKETSYEDSGDHEDSDLGNDEREALLVAKKIRSLGPPWKDICVLVRATTNVHFLTEALSSLGVPNYSESRKGFLTAVEILEVQALLRCLYNPFDEISLLGALRGPAARWDERRLLRLRMIDQKAPFYYCLDKMSQQDDEDGEAARDFLTRLNGWRQESIRLSMGGLMNRLYDDLHLVESVSVRPGGDQRRLNLLKLVDYAKQFDGFLRTGLGEFLNFLKDLIDHQEDMAPPSALPEGADVVRILTFHKSKGMEFPVVIIPYLGRQFDIRDQSAPFLFDRQYGVATKFVSEPTGEKQDSLFYKAMQHRVKVKQRQEELRLLYVALTRAKEAVYTYATIKDPLVKIEEASEAKGQPLSDEEILGANRYSDWLISFAGRRWDINELRKESSANDGIAALVLVPAEEVISVDSLAEEPHSARIDPVYMEKFHTARLRAQHLLAMEAPENLRAKVSVTELKRAFDSTKDGQTPPLRPPAFKNRKERGWFPDAEHQSGGARKGTATHRFLALCDVEALTGGERKLTTDLNRLVEEGLMTREEADLIPMADVAWFLNSDLGRRMRAVYTTIRRERPFTAALDGDPSNPASKDGPILLQGVVDLLFWENEDRLILVDYKTDFCGASNERLPDLIEGYAPQLRLYCYMVEETLGRPVDEAWLAFLSGRHLESVTIGEAISDQLAKIIDTGAVLFEHASGKQNVITKV